MQPLRGYQGSPEGGRADADMEADPYIFIPFADGVSVVHHKPNEAQPPPKPAGTRVTLTQHDDQDRPSLSIFFPAMWHSRPSVTDPLANRLRHLSLAGEPRPMEPDWNLCTVCVRLGKYIEESRQAGAWGYFESKIYSIKQQSIALPHTFILGNLDDVLRTPGCALCCLVSTALEECFGGRMNVPLSYETPEGTFPQQCAVHFHSLVSGIRDIGFNIALSSADTLISPMYHSFRLSEIGQKYAPQIRLVQTSIPMLPSPIRRATEIAKVIDTQRADLAGARERYQYCTDHHNLVCEVKENWPDEPRAQVLPVSVRMVHGIPGLRLIDVEQMCVVHAPQKCNFFALSYVEGATPFLTLTMDTYSRLSKRDSLTSQDVPRTFADAIAVTKLFGCRYLWIAALCIVNDGDGRRAMIERKSDIFGAAQLTIISADGTDPNYGLTGSSPNSPRAARQTVREIGGLQFAVMTPKMTTLMAGLPWAKDGWRYQEAMFSKRLLVFTPSQVYYTCKLSSFSEDTYIVPGPRHISQYASEEERHPLYCVSDRHYMKEKRTFRLPQHWFSYAPLVQHYSSRRFANESDVLQAITSILRAMTSPRMEKYIAALPTTIFEYALLWQSLEPPKRRPCSRKGHPFPTWSWVGWTGASRLPHYTVPPGYIYPVVDSWIFLTPPSSRRREDPEPEEATDESEDHVREYTEVEVHRDLLPFRPEAYPISQEMPFEPTRWMIWDKIPQALQRSNPFFSDDPDYFLDLIPDSRDEVERAHPLIESGVLSFTTTSRIFTVESTALDWTYKDFPSDKTACFRVKDHDAWIGTVQLPREAAKGLMPSEENEAEFILISETHAIFDEPPHGPEAYCINYGQFLFDVDKFERVDQSSRDHKRLIANVMWIRRSGGLAFRVCLGQIHLHAWRQANPAPRKMRILLA